MPQIENTTMFVVEGWNYAGQHQIKRFRARNERHAASLGYYNYGFNPKEDLHIARA